MTKTTNISIRLDGKTVAVLDAVLYQLRSDQVPGAEFTRSDVVRWAIRELGVKCGVTDDGGP
jgi:hypothetical protein